MTLLTPFALLFGLFAAVPLILHLYQRRRKTVLAFSTNRFFTASIIRAQRRLRLRRVLLLLLRVAACLALALALSQPIMTLTGLWGGVGGAGGRDVVVILDDSLSMTAGDANLSHFDQARQLALRAVDHLASGDRVSILTTSGKELSDNFSADLPSLRQRLVELSPTQSGGDVPGAIAKAAGLFRGADQRARLLLLISDGQAGDFPLSHWSQPDHPVAASIITLAPPAQNNVAVTAPRLTQPVAVVGQPNAAKLRIVNFGPATVNGRLRLLLDGEPLLDHPVTIPGRSPHEELAPLTLNDPGDHRLELRFDHSELGGNPAGDLLGNLPGDLPGDNVAFAVATATPRLSVLLVDGAANPSSATPTESAEGGKTGAFYVRAALEAISAAEALQVDVIAAERFDAAALDSYRVVMLCDVASLDSTASRRLRDFVRQGGGLAIFLGSHSDPAFYNATLAELTPGVVGALVSPGAADAQQAWHILSADLEHPVLARFADELQSAVAGVSVTQAREVSPREASVIAGMEGGRPLLLERGFGQGRVLLLTTDMTPASTNLPVRRLFLPLMGRLVSHLAGGARQETMPEVGRPLTVARGGGWNVSSPLALLTPSGQRVEVPWTMRGLEPLAMLPAASVTQAGFFALQAAPPDMAKTRSVFAVNVPRAESDPTRADMQHLAKQGGRWAITPVDATSQGSGQTALAEEAVADLLDHAVVTRGIWDALLWLALAFVLIEPLVANLLLNERKGTGGFRGATSSTHDFNRKTVTAWPKGQAAASIAFAPMLMMPNLATIDFTPAWNGLMLAAVCLAIAAVIGAYLWGLRWRGTTPAFRAALLSLRLIAVAALLLALSHPVWQRTREVTQKPVLAVVVDDSASMNLRDGDDASPSRHDDALATLASARRLLRDEFDLRVFSLGGREWEHDSTINSDAGDDATATHAVKDSPLSRSLLAAQRAIEGDKPAGILLLSDGIEADDAADIPPLAELHLPIFTVALSPSADAKPRPDLAITSIAANEHALMGNTVRVTVGLNSRVPLGDAKAATGAGEKEGVIGVPISILHGDEVVASRIFPWRAGDTAARAEIEFVPTQPGRLTYSVQVGAASGEGDLSDNRRSFEMTVRAKPLTVIYVDGVLRWEGKFIRQALADDPDINVVSSVRTIRPGADGGSRGLLLPEQLANVEVVILGDVEATYFSAAEFEALSQWVKQTGGGLLVTGGYRSFGPEGLGRSPLRNILPVEFSSQSDPQLERPVSVKLTPAGREHPVFHFTGDRVRDAAFFAALPDLPGLSRVAGIKPGAEVLAVSQGHGVSSTLEKTRVTPGDAAVLTDDVAAFATDGLPVLISQQVGQGRAMVLTADATWRWRMVVGGFTGDTRFYQRFWGQMARSLAGRPGQDKSLLTLSTDRHRYAAGDNIALHVQLAGEKRDGWRVEVRSVDERGKSASAAVTERGAGGYEATLPATSPGRLDLFVRATPPQHANDKTQTTDTASMQSEIISVQVQRPDLEALRTTPDNAWLSRVSQYTGGRHLSREQLDTWARTLAATWAPSASKASIVSTQPLWRHPVLALIFFTALCAEWILRRRTRLP